METITSDFCYLLAEFMYLCETNKTREKEVNESKIKSFIG